MAFMIRSKIQFIHIITVTRQNRLRFAYIYFKSRDQFLNKTSFDFSNVFHAMQSCAMGAESSIIQKLSMCVVT